MCFLSEKEEEKPTPKPEAAMPYKEGIYFNMAEEEYFKIPYFSRSGGDDILFDAEEFWHKSPMNPNQEDTVVTPAMELGTAIHCAVLEPKRFSGLYVKRPTLEDFEGKNILKTSEDIKAFLGSLGEKKTGKKEDLIARAIEYLDPRTDVIWDEIQNNFNAEVEAGGKRVLSEDFVDILAGITASLARRPAMLAALGGMRAEVVIIYKDEETGIMCKCMLDGLRPEGIVEVKSFSVKDNKKPLKQSMLSEINYRHYNHQYYNYMTALEVIIKKINAGKAAVFGEVDEAWLKKLLKTTDKQFFMMFFRTQAPYQCGSYELEKSAVHDATTNVYYEQGKIMWRTALLKYKYCCDKFGVSRWLAEDNNSTLADEDIPNIIYQTSGM